MTQLQTETHVIATAPGFLLVSDLTFSGPDAVRGDVASLDLLNLTGAPAALISVDVTVVGNSRTVSCKVPQFTEVPAGARVTLFSPEDLKSLFVRINRTDWMAEHLMVMGRCEVTLHVMSAQGLVQLQAPMQQRRADEHEPAVKWMSARPRPVMNEGPLGL
ncbi:hypothetical protein [Deinococcus sp. 6GRE01]|uniref:hypothetical protein n=1 Tax=Deinococcus sp. 6GRE01 TaxID=2745873 RepID=UPI001E4C9857|nr:hypothetical protein [Deinococcus sp. 6GRE01]MCD0155834.1 hypothetical protein [Deinococcus sp. 6GRE01]